MALADEPAEFGRDIECGWGDRPQSAPDVASRLQALARRLGAMDPDWGRIRPDPGMRKFRPGDRGPIVDMETSDLADLIDRRGRFDPPKYPAPLGPTGYDTLYRSDHLARNPSFLSVWIRVGQYGPGWVENRVEVRPDNEHRIWRDHRLGTQVLDALVEIWDPEWACAYGPPIEPRPEDDEVSRARPWLAWARKPLGPRPCPPYGRPFPFPFPLDHAGPPAEVRAWHGAELQFWP